LPSKSGINPNWLEELDYWRGIAFLGVALQHVLGVLVRDPQVNLNLPLAITLGLCFNLAKFAVPAFVLVSGLVLFRKYLSGVSAIAFYRQRGRELLIPYLFWTLIYQLYYTWGAGAPTVNLQDWVHQSLTGNGAYHLWYVVLILQFYLLFPLLLPIFRWLTRNTIRTIAVLLGAGLIYLLLMWLSYYFLPGHAASITDRMVQLFIKYRDRNLLFWFYYFLVGGVIGLYLKDFYRLLERYRAYNWGVWCLLLIWVTSELAVGISNNSINLGISSTLKPSMLFFTVSSLFLLYDLCLSLRTSTGWLSRLLKAFGRYSLGAYFIHALTLALAMSWLRSYQLTGTHPYLSLILAWILCVLLALLATFLLSYLPGGRWLIGSSPRKKGNLIKK